MRRLLSIVVWLVPGLWSCGECKEDFDCPGTLVCDLQGGTCEAFVCARDRDCPPTRTCRRNQCRTRNATPPAPDRPDAFVLTPPG